MIKNIEDLIDSFALFDSWDDRYAYLIDLGGRLSPMDEADKVDENIVKGCTSRVWLVSQKNKEGCFHFMADSDARIVQGLIYLLLCGYEGKTAAEIRTYDIENDFDRLGLHQHLSPNRRNGFFAMVEKIKALAQ